MGQVGHGTKGMTAKTVQEQKPHLFRPGQSGNPRGRPQGSRHKTSMAIDALLDGDAERLTRKAIEMALSGDGTAMRLCLDRIAPARKDRPVPFTLPTLKRLPMQRLRLRQSFVL